MWTVEFQYGVPETLYYLTPTVVRAVRGGSN